ncbi:MAG TPA: energy transducer TonB [Salegentibacter sp.]|nr:energy transducer TonB [Salegentibacter sp.]
MDFFDKHKALIITILFCSLVVLALYNFTLSQKQKQISEMIVDLENFIPEEEEEEPVPEEETPEPPKSTSRETHRAFDENQEERERNFDRELEEIFERNSAQSEETSEEVDDATDGEFNVQKSQPKKKETSQGDNSTEKISTQSGSLRNSSISFSLKGRNAVNIPNPVYTCDRAGKVVINIRVDSNGRVLETSVNTASSTTTNQCLTENALQYAADAVFSQMPGRENQPGTITYEFQP